jgi:benzylsuccinate CoA-transferase BbsF subunit
MKPLAGLRVLDFFWLIAGPLTTRILADFGAEVIKVESAERVDQIRIGTVRREGDLDPDAASVFADCNSGKRCITLNLNAPRGLALVRELAAVSDIVANNFTGDRMDRWGLGYEALRRINPGLIVVSMPAMGTTGPWKRYGANGNGVAAAAGFNALMGFPGRPPVGMGPLYPDFTNPFQAATAIFAALHYRTRTGRGQFLDIGQYQANVSLLDTAILDRTVNGVAAAPNANRSPHSCPHGVYRCRGEDEWVAIEVTTDALWLRLSSLIGRDDLAADPRLGTLAGRKAHEDELDRALGAWTATRDRWAVMEQLQAAGIAAGVVQTIRDQLERDPRLGREHFQRVTHPAGYEFTVHRLPIRVNGEAPPATPHPAMGADNDYVFGEILGLPRREIEALTADGVLL